MTRQEAIERWKFIANRVFWAEEAISEEWDERLHAARSMTHEEQQPDTLPDAPDLTLPFADIIERARLYVHTQFGSFEKFAEYGLIA